MHLTVKQQQAVDFVILPEVNDRSSVTFEVGVCVCVCVCVGVGVWVCVVVSGVTDCAGNFSELLLVVFIAFI